MPDVGQEPKKKVIFLLNIIYLFKWYPLLLAVYLSNSILFLNYFAF